MDIFKEIADVIQEGLNSIFERWDLVLWQLGATIILLIAIRVFLWKPITKFLDQRSDALSRELHEAKHERERVTQIRLETQTEYETIKSEIRELKETLLNESHAEKERIISEARAEAKRRISQVDHDIAQEVKMQNEKIKENIKKIAFQIAEKIVAHEIEEDEVDEAISELIDRKL